MKVRCLQVTAPDTCRGLFKHLPSMRGGTAADQGFGYRDRLHERRTASHAGNPERNSSRDGAGFTCSDRTLCDAFRYILLVPVQSHPCRQFHAAIHRSLGRSEYRGRVADRRSEKSAHSNLFAIEIQVAYRRRRFRGYPHRAITAPASRYPRDWEDFENVPAREHFAEAHRSVWDDADRKPQAEKVKYVGN